MEAKNFSYFQRQYIKVCSKDYIKISGILIKNKLNIGGKERLRFIFLLAFLSMILL